MQKHHKIKKPFKFKLKQLTSNESSTTYKQNLPQNQFIDKHNQIDQETTKKLWNALPFTSEIIRLGNWTIQEDLQILKLYYKFCRGGVPKWALISRHAKSNRTANGIKHRFTLIMKKLKRSYENFIGLEEPVLIEKYFRQLKKIGFLSNFSLSDTSKNIETKTKKQRQIISDSSNISSSNLFEQNSNNETQQSQCQNSQQQIQIHDQMIQHIKQLLSLLLTAKQELSKKRNQRYFIHNP